MKPHCITKTVPNSTKIYSSLGRACKYTNTRPGSVQPVFRGDDGRIGWAVLPEKENGVYVVWRINQGAAA